MTEHQPTRRAHPLDPPHPDTVLWRYLTMAKYVSLLETRSLYFRRAALMPDTLEGTAPATNVGIRQALWERYPQFRPWIETLPAAEAQALRETYVNCWFSGDAEDSTMWDQYGDGGRGIAIRTTVGRLGAAIVPNPARGVVLVPVTYIDRDRERFVEIGNTLYWYAHKDQRFAHEREVRAITIHSVKGEQPDSLFHPVDLAAMIEEIVVGPRASADELLEVFERAEANGLVDRVRLSALALA